MHISCTLLNNAPCETDLQAAHRAAETIQKDTQDGGKAEFMKLELASFRCAPRVVRLPQVDRR